MAAFRHALTTRKGWLGLACALALVVRMLVPAGYMPAQIGGMPAITICDGTGDQMVMMAAMPGMGEMGGKHGGPHMPSTGTCPFGIAAMAWLGSVDAFVLSAPIALPFVTAHILARTTPRLRTARLRPPAQGPPNA